MLHQPTNLVQAMSGQSAHRILQFHAAHHPLQAEYEDILRDAADWDGFAPHAVVIQDGVHLGHGVFVASGTRVGRGAILGDMTVATPARTFPAHSVTQVHLHPHLLLLKILVRCPSGPHVTQQHALWSQQSSQHASLHAQGTVRLQEGELDNDLEAQQANAAAAAARRASVARMRRETAVGGGHRFRTISVGSSNGGGIFESRRSLNCFGNPIPASEGSSAALLDNSAHGGSIHSDSDISFDQNPSSAASAVIPHAQNVPASPFDVSTCLCLYLHAVQADVHSTPFLASRLEVFTGFPFPEILTQ